MEQAKDSSGPSIITDSHSHLACLGHRRGASQSGLRNLLMCPVARSLKSLIAGLFLAPWLAAAVACAAPADEARQAWQLLDYLSVDYAGAVSEGRIRDQGEYAEMREFGRTVRAKLGALPPGAGQAERLELADKLVAQIEAKAPEATVSETAKALASRLLAAYPIETAPPQTPDLARGASLYAQQCSGCHGQSGRGDGPAAVRLEPRPVAFTDRARAVQRSPLSYYQVISQGVPGTRMPSFAQLSDADRWSLAFHVSGLSFTDARRERGRKEWSASKEVQSTVPSLEALSQLTERELAGSIGPGPAQAIVAYLRAHPDVPAATGAASRADHPLALARQRLDEAISAYARGDRDEAGRRALSAYLDGVEPVEPTLAARDPALLREIESAMGALRSDMRAGAALPRLKAQAAALNGLFDRSEAALASRQGSATTAFLGSLAILVREGLEALLIIVGMIAFLRKANRRETLRYVHAGWTGALLAGAATWAVATYLVGISGANREVTEGLSSLFAAVVLLSVGIWMHQKSMAGRWQHYLHERLSAALTGRTAWFLFLLSFIAVYREVFETILFYAAMWNDQDHGAIVGGLAAGSFTLAAIAYGLLRLGARLPIGKFFAWSSILIAVLAVVLIGKGMTALQEAGWVEQTLAFGPHIDWLGIAPTWQSLLAQVAAAAVAIFGFYWNTRPVPSNRRT